MNQVTNSLSEVLDRIYRNFFLRDILAYTLPGLLFLSGILAIVDPSFLDTTCPTQPNLVQCLIIATKLDLSWHQIAFLLGSSYVVGWILQAVHFAIIDWGFAIVTRRNPHLWQNLLWPVFSVYYHTRAIAHGTDRRSEAFSLNTIGSLAPDKALRRLANNHESARVQATLSYTERLSALMLMLANLVAGGGVLMAVAVLNRLARFLLLLASSLSITYGDIIICLTKFLVVLTVMSVVVLILMLIYSEFWRMYYARNLRVEYIIDSASALPAQTEAKDPSNSST